MSTDPSTHGNQPFYGDADAAQKLEALRNDRAQHQPAPVVGTTYHAKAQSEIGQELGRFAYLTRGQQTVIGSTANPYPVQPASSPWGANSMLPDERPFPVDISKVLDTETLDGRPRAKPETGKV
jgi:hypothetical protein